MTIPQSLHLSRVSSEREGKKMTPAELFCLVESNHKILINCC